MHNDFKEEMEWGQKLLHDAIEERNLVKVVNSLRDTIRWAIGSAWKYGDEYSLMIRALTETHYKIKEVCKQDKEWLHALGWINATQHVFGILSCEAYDFRRANGIFQLLKDKTMRKVLEYLAFSPLARATTVADNIRTVFNFEVTEEHFKGLHEAELIKVYGIDRYGVDKYSITPMGRLILREYYILQEKIAHLTP